MKSLLMCASSGKLTRFFFLAGEAELEASPLPLPLGVLLCVFLMIGLRWILLDEGDCGKGVVVSPPPPPPPSVAEMLGESGRRDCADAGGGDVGEVDVEPLVC